MRDQLIRQYLHETVLLPYHQDDDTRVLDELGINHGSVRVDIAVVNGILHGYEIKGAFDTLNRLPAQVKAYSAIFDKVTLVVSNKYFERALDIVPDWWEVLKISENKKGKLKSATARRGRLNREVNPYLLAKLLWRAEAIELLKSSGREVKVSKCTRDEMYKEIAKNIKVKEIRDFVAKSLKERQHWRDPLQLL